MTLYFIEDSFTVCYFARQTMKNLNEFLEALKRNEPLFCIDAVISIPDVILHPTGIEVYNIIIQRVNGFMERYFSLYH